MNPEDILSKPLRFMRGDVSRRSRANVDREGGMYGAGLISGVSLITRGEALGHEMWIDADFLSDVTAALNATPNGIKSRFTHPGLSSDGTGQFLGRLTNAHTEGDQVFADLHLSETATKAPDGDLADYVMTLAEEDPEAFGLSIVFEHNFEAAELHRLENTENGHFISPDEDNRQNYEHARLRHLRAGDVVDEPAANPNGLFSRKQEVAADAESLMEYAFGLSGELPELKALHVDADRVSAAVSRFLSRHKLQIRRESDMAEETVETPEAVVETQPTREQFAADLKRFTEAFGKENGQDWFLAGKSFGEGLELHCEALATALRESEARVAELEKQLADAAAASGMEEAGSFGAGVETEDATNGEKRPSFAHKIRIAGRG